MTVHDTIRAAERVMPGTPGDDGSEPWWKAIIAVGGFIESEPEAVWACIRGWGCHRHEDLRTCVAVVLLEHLLEHHFAAYFPRVEELALTDPLFADTFRRCGKFGQSLDPANETQFDVLAESLAEPRRDCTGRVIKRGPSDHPL